MSAPKAKVEPQRPRGRRAALVVVDCQVDLMNKPTSAAILPVIASLRKGAVWETVVLTQTWYSENHSCFLSTNLAQGADVKMFQTIELPTGPTVLWPNHCVADTKGAEIDPGISQAGAKIVRKGQDPSVAFQSAFTNNNRTASTNIAKQLKANNITDVYFCGPVMEFGVGMSALDAQAEGFTAFVLTDATGSHFPAKAAAMKLNLEKAGVTLCKSELLLADRVDKRQQAANYMEEHRIPLLFEKLCTALVFHKPDNPKEFMVQELQRLQKLRRNEMPRLTLMDDGDLETMFNTLDPIGTGVLAAPQVLQAMAKLGLSPPADMKIDDKTTFNVTKFKALITAAR